MKKTKGWESIAGYLTFLGLVIGQLFIGVNFALGEVVYILTDLFIIARDFALKRPFADKIKNIGLTLLTIGALLFNLLKH